MNTQTQTDFEFLPVVPIDDDTRAMLAYAASSEGRARINGLSQSRMSGKSGGWEQLQRRFGLRRWNVAFGSKLGLSAKFAWRSLTKRL
jgi:hypothetical protein